MTEQRVVLGEPTPSSVVAGLGFAAGLRGVEERPDGSILFRWWTSEFDPALALGVLGRGSATATVTAEIAIFDPDGSVVERRSAVVPTSTTGGTIATRDFVSTNAGIGLVTARTSTTALPRGTKTVLVYSLISIDGSETIAVLAQSECSDCSFHWSTAYFGGHVVVLYSAISRRMGIGLPSTEGGSSEIKYFILAVSGEVLSSGTLGIQTGPPSLLFGAPAFELISERMSLLVKTQTQVHRVDASLNVIAGPVNLPPASIPHISWTEGKVAIVWTERVLMPPDAVTADLFLQTFRQDGSPLGERTRLSTAMSIQAVQQFGDGYAVTFTDGPHTFLSVTVRDSEKFGGDLQLYTLPSPSEGEGSPPPASGSGLLVQHSKDGLGYFHRTNKGVERIGVGCVP